MQTGKLRSSRVPRHYAVIGQRLLRWRKSNKRWALRIMPQVLDNEGMTQSGMR